MMKKASKKQHSIISDLVSKLELNACDLRCVQDGEDSYHWEVIEHWEQKPHLLTIGIGETVEKALRDAFD